MTKGEDPDTDCATTMVALMTSTVACGLYRSFCCQWPYRLKRCVSDEARKSNKVVANSGFVDLNAVNTLQSRRLLLSSR